MNVEALEDRALEFALAATVSGYPAPSFHQRLGTLLGLRPAPWAQPLLDGSTTKEGLAALQASFLSHFEVGSSRLPLHETEYGRTAGMSKGNDLADLAGFYRAYSLELSTQEGDHEVYDHLSVELEFYTSLLARHALVTQAGDAEGIEVVLETRKAFLRDHLGRLAQALTKHAQLDVESAWAPALSATVALVTNECEALGVTPPPLDYVLTPPTDEVACAVNLNPAGGRAAP